MFEYYFPKKPNTITKCSRTCAITQHAWTDACDCVKLLSKPKQSASVTSDCHLFGPGIVLDSVPVLPQTEIIDNSAVYVRVRAYQSRKERNQRSHLGTDAAFMAPFWLPKELRTAVYPTDKML